MCSAVSALWGTMQFGLVSRALGLIATSELTLNCIYLVNSSHFKIMSSGVGLPGAKQWSNPFRVAIRNLRSTTNYMEQYSIWNNKKKVINSLGCSGQVVKVPNWANWSKERLVCTDCVSRH